jgi:outer membrane protein assembly factor BamE (lipoprotein component of BamABCDE complex)
MRRYSWLVMVVGLLIGVSGCGIARQVESNTARDKLAYLQVGMEKDAVLALMGKPYTREAYADTEYLFYETNHWANDEHKRYTPILIKNGKVAGWGQKYYKDSSGQKSNADIRVKSP